MNELGGVVFLVAEPPHGNLTITQNIPICDPQLYILITFEKIMLFLNPFCFRKFLFCYRNILKIQLRRTIFKTISVVKIVNRSGVAGAFLQASF